MRCNAPQTAVKLALQLFVRPLLKRLLGAAQLRVLHNQPKNGLEHLGPRRAARGGVKHLLDEATRKTVDATQVDHDALQDFAGVRDVLPTRRGVLEKGRHRRLLDVVHRLLALLRLILPPFTTTAR